MLAIVPSPMPLRTSFALASVLVADDRPENQRLLTRLLSRAGATVTIAENGRIAIAKALEAFDAGAPFDVVLMDMEMPVIDGLTATRELRAAGYDRPVVALTGHDYPEYRARCLAAGCNDFVAKPINQKQLLGTIQDLLEPVSGRRRIVEPAEDGVAQALASDPVLRSVTAGFVASLSERAARLEGALARGDREELGALVHALKGEGASFGFPKLTRAARQAEGALEGASFDAEVGRLIELCRTKAA
jgi:CheY-like chemotaxis protein